jgi:hypothetical protein
MTRYGKFWAAVVTTALTALVTALTDGHVSAEDWIIVAMAAGSALLVVVVPNYPQGSWVEKYLKSIVTGIMALLAFLVSSLAGGLTASEIIQSIVVVLGAYGVYKVPNATAKQSGTPAGPATV